jgi:hypothetical protein
MMKIPSIYAQDDGGDDGGYDENNTPDFFGSSNEENEEDGNDGDGGNTANFFNSPPEGSNEGTTDPVDQSEETETPPPTQPPAGETPPPTQPPVGPLNDFQQKIKIEITFNVIDRTTNKIIVKDNDNIEKQIIIVTDKNACSTQTDSIELTGKINLKGIRLLADFDPCRIIDGSVTLNIPDNPNLKLAAVFIDKNGNNHAGTLINPIKIQNINKNQALFTVELDDTMKGINSVTGKTTTLTKINGLALYNNGDKPINFKSGNIAALTAILDKTNTTTTASTKTNTTTTATATAKRKYNFNQWIK